MSTAKTTTDHDTIMKWVEARGGFPARVKGTARKQGDQGVLRIDYPGFSGDETLQHISWDDWLEAFDANSLAFLYQERVGGNPSRFSKLVSRDDVKQGKRATTRRSGAKRSAKKAGSSKAGRSISAGNPSRGVREGSRTRATRTTREARGKIGRGTTTPKRTGRPPKRGSRGTASR